MPQLPLFSHPTTTVLVDDDRSSLAVLASYLSGGLAKQTFSSATAALTWLNDCCHMWARRLPPVPVREVSADSVEPMSASESCDLIYSYVADPARFDLPTVVVLDYSMPDMDGVQFCEAVSHLPVKRVMFTGWASADIAVDAFNRELIHRYIKKAESDSVPRLNTEVRALQQAYFIDKTRDIARRLDPDMFAFLRDRAVRDKVRDLMHQHGFIEHYLFTSPPGILFFDKHAEPMLMVVCSEDEMEVHAETVLNAEVGGDLPQQLEARAVVPYFPTEDGGYQDSLDGDLMRFCRPAETVHGANVFYWALFQLPEKFKRGTPFSYARYLMQNA